jgi:hypothetical protein
LSRRLRKAIDGAFAVDEIELELDGDDGRQRCCGEALEHVLEHMPRIAGEWPAIVLVHRYLHLGELVALPWHRYEGPGDRQADAVGVAFVETQASRLHRATQHVEREHRGRQQQARVVHGFELRSGDTLAPRDSQLVRKQQVDEANPRMLPEPAACRLEVRKLRHEGPECLVFNDNPGRAGPRG